MGSHDSGGGGGRKGGRLGGGGANQTMVVVRGVLVGGRGGCKNNGIRTACTEEGGLALCCEEGEAFFWICGPGSLLLSTREGRGFVLKLPMVWQRAAGLPGAVRMVYKERFKSGPFPGRG